ncbi:MAG: bifunctional proline dehydrogenase/L-glutamate gamma-semialdehyde dehydrogenase, partial [Ilumatobacteraceae bacterium]
MERATTPTPDADTDADALVDDAIELAATWLRMARADRRADERRLTDRLLGIIADPNGVAFTMRFVDRVARHRDDRAAADQLASLVRHSTLPSFLSPIDRLLLRAGAVLAPRLPRLVMPLARRRLRQLVGHLVVDAETDALHEHLAEHRRDGFELNVNLLGEMVLGEEEAQRRFERTLALIDDPAVDYVSVKVSAIASQLDLWAFETTLHRVEERLRDVLERARLTSPPTFVNLDMEEYRDLELTLRAFTDLLDEPGLDGLHAGIVLQAYLPDAFDALQRLTAWAIARHHRTGATIKVRLVKGANLAMERVEAAIHGWQQAPYASKAEVDANYKRCVDWVLTPERTAAVRVGIASHNLFDVAWAHLLARSRGVAEQVELEMLQGIAPSQARAVRDASGDMRLYTPIVGHRDFDIAIGYLFRRLEENAAPANFLRHLFTLEPGTPEFDEQAERFRTAVGERNAAGTTPRRTHVTPASQGFDNEPDTDPSLAATQRRLGELRRAEPHRLVAPLTTSTAEIDRAVDSARAAAPAWSAIGAAERRLILHRVADELAARRGELLVTMMHEGRKTYAEADPEVSEAIDFARWYADRALEIEQLERTEAVRFRPLGVIGVVPPWNFPVAIPAGGVLAALAAGNAVLFKPSMETPACAEVIASACWAAGVQRDVLQFVRTPDDDVGRRLVTRVDGVILTGAWETARLFRDWKPGIRLFAETSGKNAIVVSPQADYDLAAADIVRSAFGHSGQKCSAASLAILVGPVHDDERFRSKLVDAARSMRVGWPTEPGVTFGPVIAPASGKLLSALTELAPGERWLLEPRRLDAEGALWSPGIKDGVAPGSVFHRTECFGPVLGVMRAADLDEAIELQNAVDYGLTGGIESLDPDEIDRWLESVEIGNAYVNRHITGAI